MTSKIKIIVAVSENNVIGHNGEIPWRIPAEMQFFKETTTGHAVVMGYKTWKSILPFNKSGYLKERDNYVLSRDPTKASKLNGEYGTEIPHPMLTFSSYFDIVQKKQWLLSTSTNSDIFVIGGYEIYKKYLDEDVVDEIIISRIKMKFKGDTTFPDIDNNKWTLLSVENRQFFDILHYQRAR